MAASKKSGSRSSGSRSKKSGASSGSSGRGLPKADLRRLKTAALQAQPDRGRPRRYPAGGMSKSEESQTGGKECRPPADEPDVYVYVPKVHVGELNIDVERLEAHLALRAEVANLVNLVAGVHVAIDKVKIDLKDVDAECELKVRLKHLQHPRSHVDNARREPRAGQGAARTAGTAVESTREIGKQATNPVVRSASDQWGRRHAWQSRQLDRKRRSTIAGKASPKQLTSGSSSGTKKAGGSNGSTAAKTVAAAGVTGIVGGALIGLTQRNGGLGINGVSYRRRASASRAEQRRD